MGHQIEVLNNAATAATKRAVKARDRGNPKESTDARKRALRDTNKALRLNAAQKKQLGTGTVVKSLEQRISSPDTGGEAGRLGWNE